MRARHRAELLGADVGHYAARVSSRGEPCLADCVYRGVTAVPEPENRFDVGRARMCSTVAANSARPTGGGSVDSVFAQDLSTDAALTPDQKHSLAVNGYVVLPGVLSQEQVCGIREALAQLERSEGLSAGTVRLTPHSGRSAADCSAFAKAASLAHRLAFRTVRRFQSAGSFGCSPQ